MARRRSTNSSSYSGPGKGVSGEVVVHAATGVWYNPRQCDCQLHDLRLAPLDSGVSIRSLSLQRSVFDTCAWRNVNFAAFRALAL